MAKGKRALKKQPGRKAAAPLSGGRGGYAGFLSDLKDRIRAAQIRAALSVNRELIQLYWDIGGAIVRKQEKQGWGAGVIARLSTDLQKSFPGLAGFSRPNIYRMRSFFLAYAGNWPIIDAAPIVSQPVRQLRKAIESSQVPIVSQAVRQLPTDSPPEPMASLPWGHNVTLIESIDDPATRLWYAKKALENGWSRNSLSHWIDSKLDQRQGKAITNFKTALPPAQSDLAQQILKDPYNFDFLTIAEDALEKDLEHALLDHITRFLVELGEGFAFVGKQVRFEVDGEDFSIDLLFYHLHLRAFIVIDLKTEKFKPSFTGQMNFYLSTVDDQMRKPQDGQSIGLILCKQHSKIIAEYALRHLERPMGIARYLTKLTAKLPKELAGCLPSVQKIEKELSLDPAKRKIRKPKRRAARR